LLTEDRWLIHIIPERIQAISSFKYLRLHKVLPERLRVFIQKVNPDTLSRPGSTGVSITASIPHKDISYVSVTLAGLIVNHVLLIFYCLVAFLKVEATAVHVVALVNFDVWIGNQD